MKSVDILLTYNFSYNISLVFSSEYAYMLKVDEKCDVYSFEACKKGKKTHRFWFSEHTFCFYGSLFHLNNLEDLNSIHHCSALPLGLKAKH